MRIKRLWNKVVAAGLTRHGTLRFSEEWRGKPAATSARQLILPPRKWTGSLVIAVLFAASALRADSPQRPTYDSIAKQVMCVCGGCVAPLNQCPHVNCGTKAEMKEAIEKDIAAGKDETAILQDLTLRYGVNVLTAPPAKGFNLAVWILPGIGLIVGLAGVVYIVRLWRGRPPTAPGAPVAPPDPETLAAVEEEMKSAKLG